MITCENCWKTWLVVDSLTDFEACRRNGQDCGVYVAQQMTNRFARMLLDWRVFEMTIHVFIHIKIVLR